MRLYACLNSFSLQVLVVRTDLGMTKGKIAAQVKNRYIKRKSEPCYEHYLVWTRDFSLLQGCQIIKSRGITENGNTVDGDSNAMQVLQKWERSGQAKVALKCNSEEIM